MGLSAKIRGEMKTSDSITSICEEATPGCYLKARYVISLMMFFGLFNVYSLRNNISVAIVAMVNSTSERDGLNISQHMHKENATRSDVTSNGIFNWNSAEQGLLLGCYFYGYVITCLPGGYLAKRFGVRPVFGISMFLSSIITLFIPLIARTSFRLFVAFRILLGFLQGVSFPAVQAALGRWSPPLERSQMISVTFAGAAFGTFFVLPIAGMICDNWGWEAVFYFTGGLALIWSVVWLAIIHNTPDVHPRISEQERIYIVKSIGLENEDENLPTPWLAMFRSLPLWGIHIAHFASNWGFHTLTALLATYMATVLGFDLTSSGIFSALPFILRFLLTIAVGYVTDVIRRRDVMSTTTVRKLNSAVGMIFPAIFIVLAGYVGCDYKAAVAFFSISVAFTGFAISGFEANIIDIAPNYTGVTYGISNTIASVPGFLAPQVAGLILLEDKSLSQWQAVFCISAGVYFVGVVFYLLVASAEEQSWSKGPNTIPNDTRYIRIGE